MSSLLTRLLRNGEQTLCELTKCSSAILSKPLPGTRTVWLELTVGYDGCGRFFSSPPPGLPQTAAAAKLIAPYVGGLTRPSRRSLKTSKDFGSTLSFPR